MPLPILLSLRDYTRVHTALQENDNGEALMRLARELRFSEVGIKEAYKATDLEMNEPHPYRTLPAYIVEQLKVGTVMFVGRCKAKLSNGDVCRTPVEYRKSDHTIRMLREGTLEFHIPSRCPACVHDARLAKLPNGAIGLALEKASAA